MIRGTDGFVEWVEDAEFKPIPYTPMIPLPAGHDNLEVEQGFWALYRSLSLITPAGAVIGPLAPAITAHATGTAGTVTVIGHSLGSALATYLTFDLARGSLGRRVTACIFASPHPGNHAFAALFDQTVADYNLYNYALDIVPRVPLGLGYARLPRRTAITPASAEANIRFDIGCNHHVVCYCAMLDYAGTMIATNPVPDVEDRSFACINGPEAGNLSVSKRLVGDLESWRTNRHYGTWFVGVAGISWCLPPYLVQRPHPKRPPPPSIL